MASFSIDLALNWENQDEFKRLLQNVDEAQHAYQNALKELSDFKLDIQVFSKNGGCTLKRKRKEPDMAEEKNNPAVDPEQVPGEQASNPQEPEKTVSLAEMQRRLKLAEDKHQLELANLQADVQKQIK
ncbi:TPA: hypothetical protein ACGOVD_001907 [Streptococcus suis]